MHVQDTLSCMDFVMTSAEDHSGGDYINALAWALKQICTDMLMCTHTHTHISVRTQACASPLVHACYTVCHNRSVRLPDLDFVAPPWCEV